MALAGEKVGIPSADEAPMIVMVRYKQPLAGMHYEPLFIMQMQEMIVS